jgi:hypothetical protein
MRGFLCWLYLLGCGVRTRVYAGFPCCSEPALTILGYCGNSLSAGSIVAPATDCSFPCAADVSSANKPLIIFQVPLVFSGDNVPLLAGQFIKQLLTSPEPGN